MGTRFGTSFVAGILSALLATSCVRGAGVPAGPITGVGVRVSTALAYAQAPATLEMRERASGELLVADVNAGMHDGPWLPVPQRLAARVIPTRWLDVGGDLGWMDAGLQLRAGPLQATRGVPYGIELEWRTAHSSSDRDNPAVRSHTFRARFEAYPALPVGTSSFGLARGFGVLTAGLSTGSVLLSPFLPARFDQYGESVFGLPLNVLRSETRLELGFGVHWIEIPSAPLTFVVMPWATLHHGAVRDTSCAGCIPFDLERIEGGWGIGAVFSTAIMIGPDPERE